MMFAASPKMSPIYFDNWKPGRRDYSQAKQAEERYLKAAHKKKLPKIVYLLLNLLYNTLNDTKR